MRSTTSSRRRLQPRSPRHRQLDAVAEVVDDATAHHRGHLIIHVVEEPHDLVVGLLPLGAGIHPFSKLAGLVAPDEWSAIGVRASGTAHHLEGDRPPEPTTTTFLLHRTGEERSLLRQGTETTAISGPAKGTLPDACRRSLGLPTDPAPWSTALLWTVAWLDRILAACANPSSATAGCATWAGLARLHPAFEARLGAVEDPQALVAATRAYADAWPWHRLRAQPHGLHLPDGHLPVAVTRWMDDGFYARWALGAFPSPLTLARDLDGLLSHELNRQLSEVLAGLLP